MACHPTSNILVTESHTALRSVGGRHSDTCLVAQWTRFLPQIQSRAPNSRTLQILEPWMLSKARNFSPHSEPGTDEAISTAQSASRNPGSQGQRIPGQSFTASRQTRTLPAPHNAYSQTTCNSKLSNAVSRPLQSQ